MKAKIKSILKKILFRNLKAASFIPVRIAENRIVEKVILKDSTSSIEITDKHCIVCHSPFFIAIWLTDAQLENLSSAPTLLVFCKERVSAKVQLTLSQKVSEGTNWILIYQINSAKCYQTNLVHQAILRKYCNSLPPCRIQRLLFSDKNKVPHKSYLPE